MIEQTMFFSGGFLVACLLALMLMSVVHHRAVRLTTRRLEEAALDGSELRANMDCVRAQFAMDARRLEKRNEELQVMAAGQLMEICRKTQMVNRLKAELARRTTVAEEAGARDAGAHDLTASKTPALPHRGASADLETTLAERGLFLDRCDAQVDALLHESAVKNPRQLRQSKSGSQAVLGSVS